MSEENTIPPLTLEEIQGAICTARDSVWVVNDTITKIDSTDYVQEYKGNLERNVGHLRIITGNEEIVASGEDIADLLQAIEDGEAVLASWPE